MTNRHYWLFLINFVLPVCSYAGDFRQATKSKEYFRLESCNAEQKSRKRSPSDNIKSPKSSKLQKLHPKVDKKILKESNLVDKKDWPKVAKTQRLPSRVSRKHSLINKHPVSFLNSQNGACYCIHPGKNAILGTGKIGKVKLAQLTREGQNSWLNGYKAGDWVAMKFQQEEDFEEPEIEALQRAGRLVGSPIKFSNRKHESRFAVPVALVEGITLWEWLEKVDPNQEWMLDEFLAVEGKIKSCLKEQVHNKSMAFQDNNLDNILVNEATGDFSVVDFGNAFIFDYDVDENIEFNALRRDDFIRLCTSIFIYLEEKDYPEEIQNSYWILLFSRVFAHTKRYKDLPSFSMSARELLDMYYVSWPPFFTDYFEEEDLGDMSDKDIRSYCRKLIR